MIKNGVKETVDYLASELTTQGRLFYVAGIKFDYYYPNPLDPSLPYSRGVFHDFICMTDNNNINAFKMWVDEPGPGGYIEFQLDVLLFAKYLAPFSQPGLYIALATDEDSDSEDPGLHNPPLYRSSVADALTQAGCIVFIDPGVSSLVSYYQPLAVNNGVVEISSVGTFRFLLMRQAILGY